MTDAYLNVATINLCTEAEGPGRRMAIWFQGCDVGCDECCNPQLIPMEKANIISVEKIVKAAVESRDSNGIEGVTYLGGEPTLQKNLPCLSEKLSEVGLGIILFTGKKIDSLSQECLAHVDTVVDGPFRKDLLDSERNLLGSKNQRIIHLTKRYCETSWFVERRPLIIDCNILPNGTVFITGDVIQDESAE